MAFNPEKVTYFGETDARNKRVKFGIKAKDRTKHVYVIGKTGMGKSTLLENMAVQDIQGGEGAAIIDPHGKTAELLLDYVPEHRIKDVLYFAPFDLDFPVSFNVMEDVGYDKRHLVVSGLMSTFKKIWQDAWSARMEYILSNTLLALLEYPGSTLLGVNKMLSDKDYRKDVVNNIQDPSVKAFWVDEFAKYNERYMQEAGDAIKNKIGQFTSNPLIRNIIGQSKSSFDIRKMMDEGKIIIMNLSKGRVGESNANLLGSMLITKIYLAAMSRADVPESQLAKLPNFYLYVDEFQSFANESFADILSEARKYKLNLTVAHQYIEQMSEEVRAAVFGNVGTMITFRVGSYDAEVLEKEFAPQFTAEDLVNLGFTQIYLKLMIDGVTSYPFSATTLPPIPVSSVTYKEQVMNSSRDQFTQERSKVELEVRNAMGFEDAPQPAAPIAERKPMPPREPAREPMREPTVHAPVSRTFEKRSDEPRPPRKEVKESNPPLPGGSLKDLLANLTPPAPAKAEEKKPIVVEKKEEVKQEEKKVVVPPAPKPQPQVAVKPVPPAQPKQEVKPPVAANPVPQSASPKEPTVAAKNSFKSALSQFKQTNPIPEPLMTSKPTEIPEDDLRNVLKVPKKEG